MVSPPIEECGNSYCGSLYAGLLSLITNKADELQGKRILMFSYGSGLAATLFSIRVEGDVRPIKQTTQVQARLESRKPITASEFEQNLAQREAVQCCQ
jgi:hydroxymethylglutaryl-CoA synthase